MLFFRSLSKQPFNLIGSSVDTGPRVEDEQFMGLSVGVHDCLQVLLIFFAALPIDPDHWLAATRHRGLALGMDP